MAISYVLTEMNEWRVIDLSGQNLEFVFLNKFCFLLYTEKYD